MVNSKRLFARYKGVRACKYGFACRDCGLGNNRSRKKVYYTTGRTELTRVIDKIEKLES